MDGGGQPSPGHLIQSSVSSAALFADTNISTIVEMLVSLNI
jgi:hypothetical protein